MYMKMAKGSSMQKLRPEAAQPKYTGMLPTTEPTKVFISDFVFIFVYTNKYPPQTAAPIAAVIGLQVNNPPIPINPKAMPLHKAQLGLSPSTNGLWHVLFIFRSYQISIYWLRDCDDMDSATVEANKVSAEMGVLQRLKEATVTMPFNTDNLNLVNSKYCLMPLAKVVYIDLRICLQPNLKQREQKLNQKYLNQTYSSIHIYFLHQSSIELFKFNVFPLNVDLFQIIINLSQLIQS